LRWLNTDDQGNSAVLHGTITELEPLRVIEYLGDIHGRLRWELRRDGNGCVLTFTSTLPAPNERLVSSLAGWDIHLDHLAAAHVRPVARPDLAVARHADEGPRLGRGRSRGPAPSPVHQDAHAPRRAPARRARHLHLRRP